jgi:uncharacterized linocin/CFP29 family protein
MSMDILRRSLAPITDAAWAEINDNAQEVLKANLSARKIVDVSGPHGLDHAAVNLGRLDVPTKGGKGPVRYGIHKVLPLVEARAAFEVGVWELDNAARGARDIELDDLRRAARDLAKFEEEAIYQGFRDGGIVGLLKASEHEPVSIPASPDALPEGVGTALLKLRYAGVEGPYALAVGAALYRLLEAGCEGGYPISRRVEEQVGGPVILAPYLEGGVLASTRGGDFELTVGQDVAIGYESHDSKKARLYLTESFTFRVLAPEAVVPLTAEPR